MKERPLSGVGQPSSVSRVSRNGALPLDLVSAHAPLPSGCVCVCICVSHAHTHLFLCVDAPVCVSRCISHCAASESGFTCLCIFV